MKRFVEKIRTFKLLLPVLPTLALGCYAIIFFAGDIFRPDIGVQGQIMSCIDIFFIIFMEYALVRVALFLRDL